LKSDAASEVVAPSWDARDVAELLDLTPTGEGRFRSQMGERNEHGRIYGGQLLGQVVMAASRTAPPGRLATYLQFLFAAGGAPEQLIDYEVVKLQDGKRFTSRNVRGTQRRSRILCDASVTFASKMESPSHGPPAAQDSGLGSCPDELPGLKDIEGVGVREVESVVAYIYREHPAIDLRLPFVEDVVRGDPLAPRVRFWIRVRAPLSDDPALHAAAFAYISDYWINFVACIAHVHPFAQKGGQIYVASLNHAIWFHTPFRADQWLLFDCTSPRAALGRGLSMARIYARSGELVASATQECLLSPMG
jgi:acyl-CoA thioesterase II